MTSSMDELIGKRILDIQIADSTGYPESVLIFDTDQGAVAFEVHADCCSETWFADITGVDALRNHTVASVEDIGLPEPRDDRTRQEYDSAYGVKITTEHGVADIVYRNSSNGYYGGWCGHCEKVPAVDNVRDIREDWSA